MKLLIVVAAVVIAGACNGSAPEVSQKPVTNTKDQSNRVSETVASHTLENKQKKPEALNSNTETGKTTVTPVPLEKGKKRKWSRSGDPIDTSKLDAAVKAAGTDNAALGKAYFERGVALTSARQYASAIGDFRRALSNNPTNEDAKKQIAMISSIYNSMNIEIPKVGEEPAPLEFKK